MSDGMRERILEASLRIIYDKGISNFKLEEVSLFLNISRKTIYNHFSSKKNLIKAALTLNTLKLGNVLDELGGRDDIGFIKKIEIIVEIAFTEFQKWERSGYSDGSYFWEQSIEMPITALRQKVVELVIQLIHEGVEAGVLRKDISVEILPYYYMNMIEGAVKLHEHRPIPIGIAEFLKESLKISLKGVLTEEAGDQLH